VLLFGWAIGTSVYSQSVINNADTINVPITITGNKGNGNSGGSTFVNVLPCLATTAATTNTNNTIVAVNCRTATGDLRIGAESGSIFSGALASGALASGSIASGAIASGAFAAGALNSALPDPCLYTTKLNQTIDIVTATTTTIINQSGSNRTIICGISIIAAGADNVALVEDATNDCASPSAGLYGGVTAAEGWNLVANEGTNIGFTNSTVTATSTTNMDVCLITSAAVQLSGTVSYVQVP
jgi:hypothetical protein